MEDKWLVPLLAIIATIITNLVAQVFLKWFHPAILRKEAADAATAYEELNTKLRTRIESLEAELEKLMRMKMGPFRIVIDVLTFPEPRILHSQVDLLPPAAANPKDKDEESET